MRRSQPDNRNRAWNLLIAHWNLTFARLWTLEPELIKLQHTPNVVSIEAKRLTADLGKALKDLWNAYKMLQDKV